MRRDTKPVDVETLSAYLDGELDEARCAAVERHLADHREAAARLAEYRRRDEALRLAFAKHSADQAMRPLPRVDQTSPSEKRRFRLTLAAAMLGAILGASGWWYASSIIEHRALAGLARDAVAAHLLYASGPGQRSLAAGGLPGDLTGDRDRASASLSVLLGTGVTAPNLSALGLRFVWWRELPADRGPAALLVYQGADGGEVSCYFRYLASKSETGFTRQTAAGMNVIYRLDEHLGYAVVAALPFDTLQQIARAGYLQNSGAGQ